MLILISVSTLIYADVAELADALVLGTSVNDVGVQVPSSAPTTYLFELFRTDRYENQSEMVDFFYCEKSHPIPKRKDGDRNANS